jgi:hypothetical protein
MDCPKCQTANPEGKKFCRQCGAKLALACPQCAAEILPGDKFCGECGHNLDLPSEQAPKELSFDEKIDKIQRYLPKGLTEKILYLLRDSALRKPTTLWTRFTRSSFTRSMIMRALSMR